MNCGFIAAASLRLIGTLHPAMQYDGEMRLLQRVVAMCIGRIGAGWLAEMRDFAIPKILVSLAEPVALDGIMEIKGKLEMKESKKQKWRNVYY